MQDAAYDQMVEEILEDNKDQIIEEFVAERLGSYYTEHPDLDGPAKSALQEARVLLDVSSTASLVFSRSATEIAIRDVLLRPVIYGMVHDESTANIISELVLGNRQFTGLLFSILEKHGVDLKETTRPSSSDKLWKEIEEIKDLRNGIVHHGKKATREDAVVSLELAEIIIEGVFHHLRRRITSS
jgi:hypothetical protein